VPAPSGLSAQYAPHALYPHPSAAQLHPRHPFCAHFHGPLTWHGLPYISLMSLSLPCPAYYRLSQPSRLQPAGCHSCLAQAAGAGGWKGRRESVCVYGGGGGGGAKTSNYAGLEFLRTDDNVIARRLLARDAARMPTDSGHALYHSLSSNFTTAAKHTHCV